MHNVSTQLSQQIQRVVIITHRFTWWRHQMETFSALLAICSESSPVPGEFPAHRPVTRSFGVFFDLHLNKRLSKQWWGWWFETSSCPLWCHRNDLPCLSKIHQLNIKNLGLIHICDKNENYSSFISQRWQDRLAKRVFFSKVHSFDVIRWDKFLRLVQWRYPCASWWRHEMETFSASLAICAGNSPASGEFPAQRPVTRSFDVFFHLCLNKRLRKQSGGWWFEMQSRPLWRHCNVSHI